MSESVDENGPKSYFGESHSTAEMVAYNLVYGTGYNTTCMVELKLLIDLSVNFILSLAEQLNKERDGG